ncbi:MAG: hypothetical protein JO205_06580 [Pseudolabrys sp.]|nr:hypothetical protein [Pseudolabrys sp.]MBV9261022.1 hypothetical protein [Pseudolabrys sp.]
MRTIIAIQLAAAMLFATSFSASAQKSNPSCNQDACVASCAKAGGQGRFCPQYCQKKIRENKACK